MYAVPDHGNRIVSSRGWMPHKNKLEKLRKMTTIVADIGDIESIRNFAADTLKLEAYMTQVCRECQ